VVQAVIEVVVHQGPFGLGNRLLDGVQLLGDIEAWAPLLNHGDDRAKVTLSSLEPLCDVRVGRM
jgi:hypothetical protein